MTVSETDTVKAAARRDALARRAAAHGDAGAPAAAEALARGLLRVWPGPAGGCVAAYWPTGSEIDTRPLLHALHDAGHRLCLPVVVRRGAPLLFRAWQPGQTLVEGALRIQTPGPEAPELQPEVFLVPLLAFDAAGYRLGYGGGFYDRTLAEARRRGAVRAIGVAYAAQETAALPRGAWDEPLDAIATEDGLRWFGAGED